MKKLYSNVDGFSVVELLLVIVTLAIIGVAGYFVAKHIDKNKVPVATVTSSQTALVITRSNPLKQPNVSGFTIKVSSTQTANTILTDLKKLQPPLSGEVSCPEDDGVSYTLQFTSPSASYNVEASGCEDVMLNNKAVYTADTTNNTGTTFWDALSKVTGKPID